MVAAQIKLMQSVSQYYALATGVIFFYDYVLTIVDEVGQVYSARTHTPY